MTPAYTNVEGIATIIGRTPEAVRMLVKRRHIPHVRVGRKLQFNIEKVLKWMERHHRNGAFVE